jgi:hypothetical protein
LDSHIGAHRLLARECSLVRRAGVRHDRARADHGDDERGEDREDPT